MSAIEIPFCIIIIIIIAEKQWISSLRLCYNNIIHTPKCDCNNYNLLNLIKQMSRDGRRHSSTHNTAIYPGTDSPVRARDSERLVAGKGRSPAGSTQSIETGNLSARPPTIHILAQCLVII